MASISESVRDYSDLAGFSGLPVQFWTFSYYNNIPALFSTQLGTIPKRQLTQPYPYQIIRSDLEKDVEAKAEQLRKQFPNHIYDVNYPADWPDLYRYFDIYDIYVEGAAFCIHVLYRIADENKRLMPLIEAEIDKYAAEWVAYHQVMVGNIPYNHDVLNLYTRDELANLSSREITLLSRALNLHRHLLLSRRIAENRYLATQPPFYPTDPTIIPQYRNRPPHLTSGANPMNGQYRGAPIPAPAEAQPTQSFDSFMEHQRSLVGPQGRITDTPESENQHRQRRYTNDLPRPVHNPQSRRYSNDTPRNGRVLPRNQRRYFSNPGTPPRQATFQEPIYILNNRTTSARGPPEKQRIFSGSALSHGDLQNGGPHTPSGDLASNPHRLQQISQYVSSTESPNLPQRISQDARRAPLAESPNGRQRNQDTRFIPSRRSPNGHQIFQDSRRVTSSESSNSNRTFVQDDYNRRPYQRGHNRFASYGGPRPFADNSNAIHHDNGTCTFNYIGPSNTQAKDHDGLRTAFVSGICLDDFENHVLRELMGEEVGSITFLPPKLLNGPAKAFVTFLGPDFASQAITKFDGYELRDGQKLEVNFPAKKQTNHHHYRPAYGIPRGFDSRPNSRRQSIVDRPRPMGKQSMNYVPHMYSAEQSRTHSPVRPPQMVHQPTSVAAGLESVAAGLEQHQAAFDRFAALNVADTNIKKKTDNENGPKRDIAFSNKKENSPIKENRQVDDSKKEDSQSGSNLPKQGGKNKKKGSRKIHSTRQTPSASPTKSKTDISINATLHKVSEKIEKLGEVREENPTPMENTKLSRKAISSHTRKRISQSTEPEYRSQHEAMSPTDTEVTANTTFKSTTTSASDMSSRTTSVASFTSVSETATPRVEKLERDSILSSNDVTPTNSSIKSVKKKSEISRVSDTADLPTSKLVVEKPKSKKGTKSSKSVPQLDTTVESTGSAANNAVGGKERKEYQNGKAHVKKDSAVSSTSSSSQRKADLKPKPETPTVAVEPADTATGATSPTESSINLHDQEQFPSLGPAKSSPSTIVDGKRPAAPTATFRPPPIMGPLNHRGQSSRNQTKPPVAIPRVKSGPKPDSQQSNQNAVMQESFQEHNSWTGIVDGHSRNGSNSEGRRLWPFVKTFRGK